MDVFFEWNGPIKMDDFLGKKPHLDVMDFTLEKSTG